MLEDRWMLIGYDHLACDRIHRRKWEDGNRGDIPACAEACADAEKGAILFGDLNDANSDIAKRVAAEASTQIRGDLRLDPGVRYQGV